MTAQRDLFEGGPRGAKDHETVPLGPLPAFELERQFAPPRTKVWPVKGIRAHPAIEKWGLLPTAVQLQPLRVCTDRLFDLPLIITDDEILIDGYKRWMIALSLDMQELPCVVLSLSQDEALIRILDKSQAHSELNPFCCFLLARTLVGPLREKAKEHQRAAGREKHLAKLPTAEHIDVQKEIARLARTCPRNVGYMEYILTNGIPRLIQELRRGLLTIHAGWNISKLRPDEQARKLGPRTSEQHQSKRVISSSRAALGSSESARRLLDEARQRFEKLCKLEHLAKFQERSNQLLADMERELDVSVSEKIVESTQAAWGESAPMG